MADKFIRTRSLLTCMENSEFSSSYFEVTYFPSNNSIYYEIEGSSLITGKVEADYSLVVYGLSVYSGTIKLCNFDIDSICPLTAGHIDISGTYDLGDTSLGIPSIAYGVPDLDAYVQVNIYSLDDDGNVDNSTANACIQANLENGKTVQTRYAGWPIACIAGLGLVVSTFISLYGHTATSVHIASNSCSLFVYFQSLAVMACMGVAKMPPIASAWAENFVWSLGVIKAGFMQTMFYWYIQSTGGSITSVLANESVISISVQKMLKFMKRSVALASGSDSDVLDDSDLYTTDENSIGSKVLVLRGIQRVAYLADIEISNIFMTSITFFLFVGFVLIIAILLFRGLISLLYRTGVLKDTRFSGFRQHWRSTIKGLLYRLIALTFSQITLMCIWEFTRNDSSGCMAFAVIVGLCSWLLMGYATFRIMSYARRSITQYGNPAYLLFGDSKFLNKFGFIYAQYQADKYWWTPVFFIYMFVRALLIAVLQHHGKACACIIFAIEFIYTVIICWQRPYMDKRTNVFNIFIAVIDLINSVFFLFYSNVFKQPKVVSSVAAVVYFVLNAIFALVLLIMTIVSCTLAVIHRNPDTQYEPTKDDRQAFMGRDSKVAPEQDQELKQLGDAAMQGHNRESMISGNYETPVGATGAGVGAATGVAVGAAADSAAGGTTRDSALPVPPVYNHNKSSPFDEDEPQYVSRDDQSSKYSGNNAGNAYESDLQFTSGNQAETGYASNYANQNYTTYDNNGSSDTYYNDPAFRRRHQI